MKPLKEKIKEKLHQERWSKSCDRLADFLFEINWFLGKTRNLYELLESISIVETSDPHYLDRRNRDYAAAKVLKRGSGLHWSYWRYALYYGDREEN